MASGRAQPRIAVIGAGLIGRQHAERTASAGSLALIVDPNPQAHALAERLGVPCAVELDEATASAVDGVILATPNQTHAEIGLACIDLGLPLLIEKPITDTVASGRQLVMAAEKARVPLLIGHHRRYNPIIATAKAAIDAGRLGQMTLVNALFWLYKPDSYFEADWRRHEGAGPIFINLTHDIDLIRHLCGEIRCVEARQSSAARGYDIEDTAVLLLEFENGALGTVTVSDATVAPWSWEFSSGENPAYPKTEVPAYQIGGTRGALSIPDLRLWSQPEERSWWAPIDSEELACEPRDPFEVQLGHFEDVIIGKVKPSVTGADGLRSLAVVEAIKKAAVERRAVEPEAI